MQKVSKKSNILDREIKKELGSKKIEKALKNIIKELLNIEINLKDKEDIKISYSCKNDIDITFFKNRDNFSIMIYNYEELEEIEKKKNVIIKLMKNFNKYDEIKKMFV